MGPISYYSRNSGVLQETYGTSAKEVSNKIMDPLRGKPYGVSYRKDPKFFGASQTLSKKIRW